MEGEDRGSERLCDGDGGRAVCVGGGTARQLLISSFCPLLSPFSLLPFRAFVRYKSLKRLNATEERLGETLYDY